VFNREGKFISVIGDKDSIKVATGIDADENEIFVTDSGNNRVLIYNWKGKRIGTLTKSLNYPIDIFIDRDKILISNFHKGSISIYKNI
jgi:DNA-binding beta-propeller fold protein YncE